MNPVRDLYIEQSVSHIGEKIKILRNDKELSLQQLADRAGVSATAIHKIERSGMTPTITLLMKIADALGKKVGFFIGEEEDLDSFEQVRDVEFYRKEDRKRITNPGKSIELDLMASKLKDGSLHGGIFSFRPGEKSRRPGFSHHGEELIYQIEGAIEYTISDRVYTLRPGDSLHFNAALPHSWQVPGKKRCVHFWVMTPPPIGITELSWKEWRAQTAGAR